MSDYPKVTIPGRDDEPTKSKYRVLKTTFNRRQITIDDVRGNQAVIIGEGNMSEGIRRAIDHYVKTNNLDTDMH